MNSALLRLVCYAVLALVLSTAGITWDNWAFGSVLSLVLITNYLTNESAEETGLAMGIEMVTNMTEQQRAEVFALVKQAQQELNNE